MSEITRYNIYRPTDIEPSPDGQWVKYEDVEHLSGNFKSFIGHHEATEKQLRFESRKASRSQHHLGAVLQAAEALEAVLTIIEPKVQDMIALLHSHKMRYDGPRWTPARESLQAAIREARTMRLDGDRPCDCAASRVLHEKTCATYKEERA